eukprot:Gb_22306 [translate_table: standard]
MARRVAEGGLVATRRELESLRKRLAELEKEREKQVKEEQIQATMKVCTLRKPKVKTSPNKREEVKKIKASRDEMLRTMPVDGEEFEEEISKKPMEGLDEEEPKAVPCEEKVEEILEELMQGQGEEAQAEVSCEIEEQVPHEEQVVACDQEDTKGLVLCEPEIKENWEDAKEMFLDEPMKGPEEEKASNVVPYEEQDAKEEEDEEGGEEATKTEKEDDDDAMEDGNIGDGSEQAKGAPKEIEFQENEAVDEEDNEMRKNPKEGATGENQPKTNGQASLTNNQRKAANERGWSMNDQRRWENDQERLMSSEGGEVEKAYFCVLQVPMKESGGDEAKMPAEHLEKVLDKMRQREESSNRQEEDRFGGEEESAGQKEVVEWTSGPSSRQEDRDIEHRKAGSCEGQREEWERGLSSGSSWEDGMHAPRWELGNVTETLEEDACM